MDSALELCGAMLSPMTDRAEVAIVVADPRLGILRIGPLTVDPGPQWREPDGAPRYIFGPVTVIEVDGTTWTRETGNGIDALRLAHLRSDLRTLATERVGEVCMGDQDSMEVLAFVADDDEGVHVLFTNASLDLWDHPVGLMGWDQIPVVIEQMDELERVVGPLTGCCAACGVPRPSYDPVARRVLRQFLAVLDGGVNSMQAVVLARSIDEITALYPELRVARPDRQR